ncbi:MAG: helix-turn-helix domain-containing protein [Lachnospiraceae bacterium]|nr:helix-turn-helix domain-containing protein [Lachnospiraceae bacterium]
MLSPQVIQTSIDDLKSITKTELVVADEEGNLVVSNAQDIVIDKKRVMDFVASPAASQAIEGLLYLKVYDEEEVIYVLVCRDKNDDYAIAKIAAAQLQNLNLAYKERLDKNNFFQNLILDNLLLVDIYNRAKKMHINVEIPRVVFLIETKADRDHEVQEILKSLFSAQSGDFVTSVDEKNVILIKQLDPAQKSDAVASTARTISDMINTEAMIKVRVAYGTIVGELKEVSKSYKEAKLALDVGKIFYADKTVISYQALGIGRLIYQLPVNLCEMFMNEIFGENMPELLDEETLTTVNMFLDNNLNVSETARKLFIHRNTLLYRLEKLQKLTGLDIRVFEDALTLKIALMVVSYLQYLEAMDY